MALAITKVFGSTTTTVDVTFMNEGNMERKTFTQAGRKSEKAMSVYVRKLLGTQNFLMQNLNVVEGDDEKSYSMSNELFIANSDICDADTSYGREFVTATVKTSRFTVLAEDGMKTVELAGTTTENKARKFIGDVLGTTNFLLTSTEISESRRYMTKDKFMELATCTKAEEDTKE